MKRIFFTLLNFATAASLYSQSWTTVANVPGVGREAANSFVINGMIYVGGGVDSARGLINDFYQYNPATNVWTAKATIPDDIGGSACFTLNGKGYMVSGADNSGRLSTVYQYDPVLDQWNTMNPFPGIPAEDPSGFSIGDTGYVFGGFIGGAETNALWAYNPVSDSWTQEASMPSVGRGSATGFVLNNIGYVGLGEYNSGANLASDFGSYNPATNTWGAVAQFPGHLRSGPLSFALGNFAYVGLGNFDSSGVGFSLNDIYQYNPTNNSWVAGGNFPGLGRGNSIGTNVGDTIYVGTGQSDTIYFTDWWRYIYQINLNLGTSQAVCSNSSIILNPIVTGAIAPVTYEWSSIGDSLSCYNCQNPTVTITDSSTFTLTVTDANNTVTIDTFSYMVTSLTLADSIHNATCGLSNGSAAVIVLGGLSPYTYAWGNGDTTSLISNVATGIYSVTVTDVNNCSSTLSAIVNSVGINPVIITTDTTTFCAGSGVQVCAPAGFISYIWNTGQTGNCIYAQQSGNYYVTVSDSGNCSAESNHILLTALPAPSVSLSVSGDTLRCYSGTSVQWFLNETVIVGAAADSFIAKTPGDYSVLVIDTDGCSTQSNAVAIFSAGISTIGTDAHIQIYPNPFNDLTHVVVTGVTNKYDFELYDVTGRLSREILSIQTNQFELTRSDLAEGVYFYRILVNNNQVANGKLVVQSYLLTLPLRHETTKFFTL